MPWREFLTPYSQGDEALFDNAFLERWKDKEWSPVDDDQVAAAKLHVQIISRITTQPLGYLEGDEKTALTSVYRLFDETREICYQHPKGKHFAVLAWHVLNTHVRPFTAKWHPIADKGMLNAIDTTDEFRADLEERQKLLGQFELLLARLRDGEPLPPPTNVSGSQRVAKIAEEMKKRIPWGIPENPNNIRNADFRRINAAEKAAIRKRRKRYNLTNKEHAVGLALSGGGIRSATFSLGVLIALAKRNLLPQFDYLSTVSGGGYLGSFLTTYLNTKIGTSPTTKPPTPAIRAATASAPVVTIDAQSNPTPPAAASAGPGTTNKPPAELGLCSAQLPFQRESGEAEALRHIRHHSKYLATGAPLERLQMVGSQLWGMCINGVAVVFFAAVFVCAEKYLRHVTGSDVSGFAGSDVWPTPIKWVGIALGIWAIVALILGRFGGRAQKIADSGLVFFGGILGGLFAWWGLNWCHRWIEFPPRWEWIPKKTLLVVLGAIPAISSVFAGVAKKIFDRLKFVLGVLSAIAAPLFFFGVYLALYRHATRYDSIVFYGLYWFELCTVLFAILYYLCLNVNVTAPHRHYRRKLAEAYLIQPAEKRTEEHPFEEAVRLKLSDATSDLAPYHLINAALNVPGSKNPSMQGRLTDFFLFSHAFCGSPLTGYRPTEEWQDKDKHLDIGTAMAISGAAAAPQMGLGTRRQLSFWLALLNVRLGYWVRNPTKTAKAAWYYFGSPGLSFLLREMLGTMNEKAPWLYVSDGGHIENLGVYELLRRRCKYIVAIDGEQDQRMTFGALTTLQRLAAIDLGVKIDINLDDLRLNEQGLSRSHFRFARIHYPDKQYGYLLYVKSSLTGNEGEFLRRYRFDDPAFPHDPTANQFFSEAQFEAYRSLGEHIGDKLFLRALVGADLAKLNSIEIETWFRELGTRLLEPC